MLNPSAPSIGKAISRRGLERRWTLAATLPNSSDQNTNSEHYRIRSDSIPFQLKLFRGRTDPSRFDVDTPTEFRTFPCTALYV
jgi:hypothetical protein